MSEPRLMKCGVRHSFTDEREQEWDIECRFDDGQKFAAVKVDIEFEELAHRISNFLCPKNPIYEFRFYDFPEKVSTNDFYESKFWAWRQQIKKRYADWLSDFYHVVKADKKYDVDYDFEFEKRPYDSSNTSGMLKMIEDVLFEKDNYKVVRRVSMMSSKGPRDCVVVKVWEVE